MWNFGKPHVEFFLKSEMDDVSINKEALLLIETSLLRLGHLGPCRWKPHVEFFLKSEMDDVSINKKALLLIKTLSISLFKFLRWPPVSPPCPTDRGDGLPARGDGRPA
jgi:hypothetical protein